MTPLTRSTSDPDLRGFVFPKDERFLYTRETEAVTRTITPYVLGLKGEIDLTPGHESSKRLAGQPRDDSWLQRPDQRARPAVL